jgi:hypothetical protein
MKEKTFKKILTAVVAAGCIITVALTIYTIFLYENSSIISFVANGR